MLLVQALSLRDKWSVYHGESNENSDLIFCAQQSKALKLKSEFDIFLANNLGKEVRDFRTSGSYTNLSFKVYKDNAVIARVTFTSLVCITPILCLICLELIFYN